MEWGEGAVVGRVLKVKTTISSPSHKVSSALEEKINEQEKKK